jgi:hypothetical protein
MVFTIYLDRFTVDVETGIVTRWSPYSFFLNHIDHSKFL